MTISTAATASPIPKMLQQMQVIDPATGLFTDYALQTLNAWYNFIVGMNRITPCNATGKNLITLTPLDASPLIGAYADYELYSFVAAQTSDGAVTATVVPRTGVLATIKAYKSSGAAQAGAGDVVAGSLYFAVYNDALDSGAGGLVLK